MQDKKINNVLESLDKMIIRIDSNASKSTNSIRKSFLEGKSVGLNESYRLIKNKFNID